MNIISLAQNFEKKIIKSSPDSDIKTRFSTEEEKEEFKRDFQNIKKDLQYIKEEKDKCTKILKSPMFWKHEKARTRLINLIDDEMGVFRKYFIISENNRRVKERKTDLDE
jgi:DNA-binding ferritin-like protein